MNYIRFVQFKHYPENDSYPFNIPAIRFLQDGKKLSFEKPVTFFVGENGMGKSTLIEAIAVASGFSAEGGSRDHRFDTMDTHSDLYKYITVARSTIPKDGFFLRAESFYNVASYLDHSGSAMARYGGISLHKQSHGESFMSLVENRFEGNGIYILDEPEAALSPKRLMQLLVRIDELVKRDSQFIISTHSPILMAYPCADIYQFSENGIEALEFKETEHYKITKMFIDRPEYMMDCLLND